MSVINNDMWTSFLPVFSSCCPLYMDEIHQYKDGARELKRIYDYHPDSQIVFTGFSFKEYPYLFHHIEVGLYSLEEIWQHQVSEPNLTRPLSLFQDYLQRGYYPFAKETEFNRRLMQIINQTLETDIPLYADMNVSTGRKLKQLFTYASP